jgi:carbamoyltransferase
MRHIDAGAGMSEGIHILGISCFYHDSAACLLRGGEILAAAQEERFTRIKHDPRFPRHSIRYCLEEAGISIQDVDFVVFYDKPFLTFERLLMSYLTVAPKGLRSWLEAMPLWLGQKLHIPRIVQRETGYEGEVLFTEHHEAHAASAFYPSPFREAGILTVDGVGEWATASYGFGKGKDLVLLKELHFPDSLGLLYSSFTYFTGFRVNSGEYKLMGLAPYGKPRFKEVILSELVDLKDDGSLQLDISYFDFLGGLRMTNERFARLFGGPPRKPETEITQREMDIAASIQAVTEEVLLRMANQVYRDTKQKNLCLAGGVALNCVANGRILREGPFENIWRRTPSGVPSSVPRIRTTRLFNFLKQGSIRSTSSLRKLGRGRSPGRLHPAKSSDTWQGGWSMVRGRLEPGAFSAIPAARRPRA